MTEEEKRIKLAVAEGWTFVMTVVPYIRSEPFHDWTDPEGKHYGISGPAIPDYFYSIEAVRRAEMKLIDEDRVPDWVANLVDIVVPAPGWSGTGRIRSAEACLRATGKQRIEALGQTLHLWKEGE